LVDLFSELAAKVIGRDEVIRVLFLSLLCGQNLLLIGPPGVGKTYIVEQFMSMIQAENFQITLHATSTTEDIFGYLDIKSYVEYGISNRNTRGMLSEAEIAFLDEIFKSSSQTRSALLSILHNKTFRDGGYITQTKLRTIVGASNEVPMDPSDDALFDRFFFRMFIPSLDKGLREELLKPLINKSFSKRVQLDHIQEIQQSAKEITWPTGVKDFFFEIVDELRKPTVNQYQDEDLPFFRNLSVSVASEQLSDRTIYKFSNEVLPVVLYTLGRPFVHYVDLVLLSYSCWRTTKQQELYSKLILSKIYHKIHEEGSFESWKKDIKKSTK
jgi:MoxR-like ATPase